MAEKEKLAKREAARATLPLVVSSLYEICENRIQYLIDAREDRKRETWSIDEKSIETMKECIEFTEGNAREALKEVISVYQVCVARFSRKKLKCHILDSSIDKWEKYDRAVSVLDWITFQALCESIFDFARSRSDVVDRMSVPQRARKHIEFLFDEGGRGIDSDELVRDLFERRTQDDEFGFAHPDWKLR